MDTENDNYNFKILDIGILGTTMIDNINAIFSKIKVVNAMAFVGESGNETTIQYFNFYAPLTYIYSRLATNKLPQLQGSKFYNCSSFVEDITDGRLDCGMLYSDPNNCKTSTPILVTKALISNFLQSFFKGDLTVGKLQTDLNYNPFSFSETLMMSAPFQGLWRGPP